MSSPNGKAEKMDVDRPKSPDRRSKVYAIPVHFTVRHWTSSTDPATFPPRPTAPDALIVPALGFARVIGTGNAVTGIVTNTTTDAGVATAGTGPAKGPTATETMTATGSGTESGTGTESGGGIVMTARGTGTGTATGTTGTRRIDAGSVEKTRMSLGMSAAKGSDLTKVLKNRLSQPRHPPLACLHPHHLSLTAQVAELVLVNLTAGTATGHLGVLATRGMTSRTLAIVESGSVAVR
ncbi:hypothetical protein L226DRAFT_27800 [Lentinus tigrinus ALCF2SS1-7]|uniref:uncharacterized protein n=1 Tax=Lentinus tigrinus ALCF2SS1-7 TaxID=1328758 RepID=UPI0011661E94|nr:hypothetical protein L226DRAFT_27800 [Lentinus tigrinus ALCF2SS1-7]